MALQFSHRSFHYRKLRRRRLVISSLIGLFIAAIVLILLTTGWLWRRHGTNSPSQVSKQTTTVNYDPLQTFRTPYFSFKADKNWQAIAAESTATTFVYRSFRDKLVERDLTVYVNGLPTNLLLTYLLPVESAGDHFSVGVLSDHCKKYVPASYTSRNPTTVHYETVSFTCQVDGTSLVAGTGLKGGSYQTNLTRQNGSSAQYFILFRDHTFSPRPELFSPIVSSFTSL